MVSVVDLQGNPIGQAFYAQKSPLALRLLTRKGPDEERIDDAFLERRLDAAIARRRPLASRDAYRVIHGEADLLPGLFVDRYAAGLSMQSLSEAMEVRKEKLAALLARRLGSTCVVARDDGSGRDFEQLPREARILQGSGAATFTFHEGATAFEVDLLGDMKTGSFLDQVDNHLRAGELGHGEALDCFSYHGGFALALSKGCTSVVAIEQDAKAAERARTNAQRNGRTNLTVETANAFDVLHAAERDGRRFDTIVLDPPALAKRKDGPSNAMRAYHELNLRAIKCLRPEGLLVSCSCSGKVSRDEFEQMLGSAAHDAKRPLQILERRGAGVDHPVLSSVPESEYLKVIFARAL